MPIRFFLLYIFSTSLAQNIYAKGLNEISKDPVPSAQKEIIPERSQESQLSEEDRKKAQEKQLDDETKKEQKKKKEEEQKPYAKSPEIIDNKLSLATSINYASISADVGDWSSTFLSELVVNYNFKNPYSESLSYGLLLRYTPFKTLAKDSSEAVELTGVVSSYNIGLIFNKSFKDKILVSLSLEGGYLNAHMKPTVASGNTSEVLKESGYGFTTGLAASYLVLEKVALGYKLSYTVGRLNIFQTGFTFNFIF